ncbi:DUF2282 domain-containing protein [Roseateles sp. DAIF2]|uniref:BufA1 family periplasmic bufferin-type metallophore n=1 Tax=Roseateles sp. DAIF2 TaxID=2714952 RepID=UPI00353044A5
MKKSNPSLSTAQILSSALAAALSLGLATPAAAQDKGAKEKCYGIAKAGQNDCANLSGTHSCAGQAKTDMAPEEWKYVAKGGCKDMKGLTADEAKAKLAKK